MRVITGTAKGFPLKSVAGKGTRPTTDKIKEAIFNIIGPYFDGGRALDLFAGSGALGIESLSRGVDFVVFFEKNHRSVQVLNQNIQFCNFETRATVMAKDAFQVVNLCGNQSFHYLFLDPPYAQASRIPLVIKKVLECDLLTDDCLIICEHSVAFELPREIETMTLFRQEKYGITNISFYKKIQ